MKTSKLCTLFHKGKKGELRQWRVWTENEFVCTEYGIVDGQLQTASYAVEAKNVGRKNETRPREQAVLEARALWKHKLDRKYSKTKKGAEKQLYLPMLAHSYKGSKAKKFTWPCSVQAKLDGVRCLAQWNGKQISLTSRQGKPWHIPHVEEELSRWLPKDTILDGELYSHGESCQQITSWCRSSVPGENAYKPESVAIMYYVYDIPVFNGDDSAPWRKREKVLESFTSTGAHIKIVESYLIDNEPALKSHHDIFVASGYEGAIARSLQGKYIWGYRSADLLKYKKFEDDEFLVLGAREGVGKFKGAVIWNCKNNQADNEFECTIRGSMEKRHEYYLEREKHIGKMLTVRFLGRTEDLKPKIAVGILFRDPKDLPKKK